MWRLLPFVLFISTIAFSQDTLKIKADTLITVGDTVPEVIVRPLKPGIAAKRSAFLPGYGQWSNKTYWKVPLAAGGVATGLYFTAEYTGEARRFNRSLKARFDQDSTTLDPFFPEMSTVDVMLNQVKYRRYVTTSILFTIYAYSMNVLDAYTTASTKFEKEGAHPPARAAFYSAMLPGLGQAYNKKYWKIPIIYAGLGTAVYFVIDQGNWYQDLRIAYVSRVDDDPATSIETEYTQFVRTEEMNGYTTQARQNRDIAAVVTGVVYLLNIIDAVVDAHFYNFDLSDDLSFHAYPVMEQTGSMKYSGVGLSINF